MGFLRIYCGSCGQSWEVYSRDDFHDWKAMTCPHCFKQIDPVIWEKQILPAFGSMLDADRELLKDSDSGYVFGINYVSDNHTKGENNDFKHRNAFHQG